MTPKTADAEIGKLMHEVFYRMLQNPSMALDAEGLWKNIKKNNHLIDARSLRDDFESVNEMQHYYLSLKDSLLLWSSEEDYVKRINTMLKNSRNLIEEINAEDYKTEQWLYSRLEDFLIFGRFDMISEYEIIDLKTGKVNDSDRNQVLFYSIIFYLSKGIIPTAKLFYLQPGKIKTFRFTHSEIWDMRKDISQTANKIIKHEFEANPGEHCRFCPFRAVCES